jgi:O-antigen/teichoic acid export membrane protein
MQQPPDVRKGSPAGSASSAQRSLTVNALANWIGFAAQVVITFFLSPILVHGLGDERYGIWSLIDSILAYLTLFDLGVAASVVRYVARFEATSDNASLNRVISTSLCIFAAAGSLALAIAVGLAFCGASVLKIPPDLAIEARWLLVLLGLNLAMGLPLGVFPAVLDGLGRYPAKTAVRTTGLLCRVPLFLLILGNGGGLIGIAVTVTVCNLVEHLVLALIARHYLPGLRFSFALADRATFRTIRGYSVDAFVAMIAGRISFQTDALVISAFLAPRFITFFVLAARLVDYAKSSLRVATTVLTPAVSALEAQGDFAAIRRLFLERTRHVLWLILPLQIGLLVQGKLFLSLWMGAEYGSSSYAVLVILAVTLPLTLSQSISARILYGIGRLRWYARATMVEALANLLLSVLLVKPLGIEGVALGTTLPHIVFNLIVAIAVCRLLRTGMGSYLRHAWLRPLTVALLLAIAWWALDKWLEPGSWMSLGIMGASCLTGYVLLAILAEWGPTVVMGRFRRWLGRLSLGAPGHEPLQVAP